MNILTTFELKTKDVNVEKRIYKKARKEQKINASCFLFH